MTKLEIADKLKGRGYDAYVDDGVVMVVSSENIRERLVKELSDIGYDASFGTTNIQRKKEEKH